MFELFHVIDFEPTPPLPYCHSRGERCAGSLCDGIFLDTTRSDRGRFYLLESQSRQKMFDLSPLTIFWLPSLSDPKAAAIESQEMEETEDCVGV